jgi:hypothetical protein
MSTRSAHPVRWVSPGTVATLTAATAYSWWAATTTPFSIGGDIATAIPLGALAAVPLAQWWAERRGAALAAPLRRLDPPAQGDGATWPLLAVLAAVVAWELFNFFTAPRATHPTVSSLYDTASRAQAWKAALFLAWLALGRELVRR